MVEQIRGELQEFHDRDLSRDQFTEANQLAQLMQQEAEVAALDKQISLARGAMPATPPAGYGSVTMQQAA